MSAAVQHLCAGQLSEIEWVDVFSALVDKSIVVRNEHADGAIRFGLASAQLPPS